MLKQSGDLKHKTHLDAIALGSWPLAALADVASVLKNWSPARAIAIFNKKDEFLTKGLTKKLDLCYNATVTKKKTQERVNR